MELAVIKQLPIITEKIKEIGMQLDERLEELKLDKLICSEETRKSIADLRTSLGKELKEFEKQRIEIKNQILEPYEFFNATYEREIKSKYKNVDLLLKNKIDEVEDGIKQKTKEKMFEFFEEYKNSKTNIQDNYLSFEELNIKIGINMLTAKGELVKKVKDEIIDYVNTISSCIETISTMEHSDEILVEYLKYKDLNTAIKNVNDRYVALNTIREFSEKTEEKLIIEEQNIEKVNEILEAPIEEQMTIDDFAEENVEFAENSAEEVYEISFKVRGTYTKLKEVKEFLENGGYYYESITD